MEAFDLGRKAEGGTHGVTEALARRRGGVLCHITSLPGPNAVGTLGSGATAFLDFVARAGLSVWQILPLNPPDVHGSPYHSASLFALDPALLDPALELTNIARLRRYADVRSDSLERFVADQAHWLPDFCRFSVAAARYGANWSTWPPPLRLRDGDALEQFDRLYADEIELARLYQFAIDDSFAKLRVEAASRGVLLFGDMPLYPAYDSADVWAHQDLFLLDHHQRPRFVAGVPPDYFSATGQLWGNPVYDWDRLAETGFAWWLDRLNSQLRLFDIVRIDHFRGLEAFWAVPPGAQSAVAGSWRYAPGRGLLQAFSQRFGHLPLVAEDLGVITPEVDALRKEFSLPGMRVLQFAFSGDPNNPHLPSNYVPNTVAYTGTHDNDTTKGWYAGLDERTRGSVDKLAGTDGEIPWRLIDVVFRSKANLTIAPLQDFLGLDSRHRMNTPGIVGGNWRWRFNHDELTPELATRISSLVAASDRVSE